MKNIYLLIICALCGYAAAAQSVEENLAAAKTAYKNGDLEDTRFALQQALSEVEAAIGREVLKILPEKMGPFTYVEEDDDVAGMSGSFVGLNVSRTYRAGEGEGEATISIMSDSPLLSGINAILAMPMIGGGDPNKKRIKIDGYRGVLQKTEGMEGSATTFDVQTPFGSSLLTFTTRGIESEAEVLKMANTIPVSRIVELTK